MIFSKRNKFAKQAEEWCNNYYVPLSPLNIVTALDAIGLIVDAKELDAALAEIARLREQLAEAREMQSERDT